MNMLEYTNLLYNAVKKASVSPSDISKGDLIVVTSTDDDIIGIVENLSEDSKVSLKTATGNTSIELSGTHFIHVIRKANDMLNLRNHISYERDLKDMTKDTHQNDGRPEYGPAEDSTKSNLPTSKISLSLKKRKSN